MLDRFADAFYVDGSLRDIVIVNTTIDDWEKLYSELTLGEYELAFECGDSHTPPPNVRELLAGGGMHDQCPRLRVTLGASKLNCFFYCKEEIEFDLDPRDVSSEDEFLRITDFIRRLGTVLEKDVVLTDENVHEFELIRYRHEKDDIVPGSSLDTREEPRAATNVEIEAFLYALRNSNRPKD